MICIVSYTSILKIGHAQSKQTYRVKWKRIEMITEGLMKKKKNKGELEVAVGEVWERLRGVGNS